MGVQRARRVEPIDQHIGARIRERRRLLGLSQQQLAERIGVTYPQAYKYERGTNRVPAARLPVIAAVLGVRIDYFYEGFDGAAATVQTQHHRMLGNLVRYFLAIESLSEQEALCRLIQVLAERQARVGSRAMPRLAPMQEEHADATA